MPTWFPTVHPGTNIDWYTWEWKPNFTQFVTDQSFMITKCLGQTTLEEKEQSKLLDTIIKKLIADHGEQSAFPTYKPAIYQALIQGFNRLFGQENIADFINVALGKKETYESIAKRLSDYLTTIIQAAQSDDKDKQDSHSIPHTVTPDMLHDFYTTIMNCSLADIDDRLNGALKDIENQIQWSRLARKKKKLQKIKENLLALKDQPKNWIFGKHILEPLKWLEEIELFREIEKLFKKLQSKDFIQHFEQTKTRLYGLIKQNVDYRNGSFNSSVGFSIIWAALSISSLIWWLEGDERMYAISVLMLGIWWLINKLWKASKDSVDVYRIKAGSESQQLQHVEHLLTLLAWQTQVFSNEEQHYTIEQIKNDISASRTQSSIIKTQKNIWNVTIALGLAILLYQLGDTFDVTQYFPFFNK